MQEWRNVGWFLKALGSLWEPNLPVEEWTSFAEGKTSRRRGVRVTTRHGCAFPFLLTLRLVSPSDVCESWQEAQSLTWHQPAASAVPGSSILEDPALSSPVFSFWSPDFLSCSTQLLQEAPPSPPSDGESGLWKISIHPIRSAQEALTSCWSAACFRPLVAYLGWDSLKKKNC